jgi:hypothetical protein
MRRYLLCLCGVVLLIVGQVYADATFVEVFSLHHRTADELIPILQPFVGDGGAISGMGTTLIVRATPSRLRQIKRILTKLDKAPRQLLITVRQNVRREQLEKDVSASGKITIGEHGSISVRNPESDQTGVIEYRRGEDLVSGRGQSTGISKQTGDTQQLRVLEGNEALIRVVSSVPTPERRIIHTEHGTTIIESTSYRKVSSGFFIRPRLAGNLVLLEVSPQRGSIEQQDIIHFQGAQTRVSGQLGEWIQIGSIGQEVSERNTGILSESKHKDPAKLGIFVMVQEIN